MKQTKTILFALAAAVLLVLSSCGGRAEAPLAALENVYLDGVEQGNGYQMTDWKQRAAALRTALEGKTFEVEVADPEASPFTIDRPFTVAHVQDNPGDGWLPSIVLEGSIITDDPYKVMHDQLGRIGVLLVSLYGIDSDDNYHQVGTLKLNNDVDPVYNSDSHALQLVVKLGGEHINVTNETLLRSLARCTRFIITMDN